MDSEDFIRVKLSGKSREAFLLAAQELEMTPCEYLATVLNLAEQLPRHLFICLAAGVPVTFTSVARVGSFDDDCGVCDG